jgi:hypothetical protein
MMYDVGKILERTDNLAPVERLAYLRRVFVYQPKDLQSPFGVFLHHFYETLGPRACADNQNDPVIKSLFAEEPEYVDKQDLFDNQKAGGNKKYKADEIVGNDRKFENIVKRENNTA